MKLRYVFGSVVLGIGLGLLAFSFALSQNLLGSAIHAYVVLSGSMEPALHVGSVVFVKTSDNYKQGDIITFTAKGDSKNLVTHKVVAKTFPDGVEAAPLFKTAGDANEDIDPWTVSPDQIVGKEFLTVPYLGYAANFVKTPKGFVALIVIPASIVIYEELKNIAKEIKNLISHALPHLGRGRVGKPVIIIFLLPILAGAFLFLLTTYATVFDKATSTNNSISISTDYEK